MAKLVSKTYGEALFELALESGQLDTIAKEVESIKTALTQNRDLLKLFNHPKLIKEEKLKLVENIFKGKVSDIVMGFLATVVEKGRYNELESILEYCIERYDEHNHIGKASVVSAIELTKQQKDAVEKKLIESTEYESFKMDYKVDSSLIGGLVIRIGDRVVDSTIKTKLDNMSKELSKIRI